MRYVYAADTHQYAHRRMQHPAGIIRYFVLFAGASNIRVLSCMNLTFLLPRSAYIVSMLSRIYFHEDSFLTGAVPYYQKPIALFRRFVCLIWNSLFFIAITLIVSVTAPRRVPRTGRMSLLIPLDSPLSWVSNRIDILQIR